MSGVVSSNKGRFYCLLLILLLFASALVWRVVHLTVVNREFLQKQGQIRSQRILLTPAYRGMITDRNGEPLAISTPVDSVWVNPKDFSSTPAQLKQLAVIIDMPAKEIQKKIRKAQTKGFIYIKRGIATEFGAKVKALNIPGVYLQREFRRSYPEGEALAHMLGFTNIDNHGVEGMELAFDDWLGGRAGKKLVIKDRLGHIIDDVETLQEPIAGHNLMLSIDRRIQYLAYRALKEAIIQNEAESGSIVILDPQNGEVLAVVNAPSFDPNNPHKARAANFRNLAMTDVFEPGSVIKAFSIAKALESGHFKPDTKVDTSPGQIYVDGNIIRDVHYHGEMTVTEVLQYSSNVGVSKMLLSLKDVHLADLLRQVGFGARTSTTFPGESAGQLTTRSTLAPFTLATLSFGYGLAVTPLQLVHAYSVFANQGRLYPVSLLHNKTQPVAKTVMDPHVAEQMLHMLESVVESDIGSGKSARITGFRVAGKTGTSRMVGRGGYEKDHHIATFVGMSPVSHPRLVMVVVVRDPKKGEYYGGSVAAPVFSEVMQGALSVLHVIPEFAIRTAV